MSLSQKELEELYQKVNEMAKKDAAFFKELKKDFRGTMEKLAGRPLPDELKLTYIEKDNNFGATYTLPDFAKGELDVSMLNNVSAGERLCQ